MHVTVCISSLCSVISQFLYPFANWRTFGLLPDFGSYEKTCVNIHMWTCIFISLGYISGIGLLDPTVNICSTVFQRMCAILHSYQEYMSSSFSTLSPALGVVSSFSFSHSDWCVGVRHCGVLCFSPVTSNVEYLFICLFAINNLKCLFKSFNHF